MVDIGSVKSKWLANLTDGDVVDCYFPNGRNHYPIPATFRLLQLGGSSDSRVTVLVSINAQGYRYKDCELDVYWIEPVGSSFDVGIPQLEILG